MSIRPSTFRAGAVIVCAALIATATSAGAAAARSGSAAPGSLGRVRYAVATPGCAGPTKPGYATCFVMRRTAASKSTRGAYAYVPTAADGPAGGYTPTDLAGAYGYDPSAKVRQTVGIVDWYDDPSALTDLDHFDAYYGLPKETSTSFRKVNQQGKASPLPKADKDVATATTLDLQSVRAVCQRCRIVLIEADNASDGNLAKAQNAAVELGATEVSDPYGRPENTTTPQSVIDAYNHPGVVITAPTGNHGWDGWDVANGGRKSPGAVSFPASLSTVVAVGGTNLAIADHERSEETVWNANGIEDGVGSENESPQGATGSGCSGVFTAGRWQSTYPGYKAAECKGHRLSSDVSAIADPDTGLDVYQTYGGSGAWETLGGTSLASSVTAAMWALAGGAKGAAYPSSALYVNAALHPKSVYDVVPFDQDHIASGNSFCGGFDPNDCEADVGENPNGEGVGLVDCSLPFDGSTPTSPVAVDTACNTVKGLDGPTGLGTPRSLRLFTATTPTLSLSQPGTVKKGKKASFHAVGKEIIGSTRIEKYEFAWGDGSRNTTTTSAKATHKYAKAGTYTVTVLVLDSRYQETVGSYRVKVTG